MSLILNTAARGLVPLILVFSVFVLLRGHNDPGGGFIGGMVAGGAFALYLLSYGLDTAKKAVRVPPSMLVGSGLLLALASGIAPLLAGRPFLTGIWWEGHLPLLGESAVSNVLTFDIGVYLLVTGMTLTILFGLAEET